MDSFFQDRVAVITGSASGIGRSLAQELGRQGARILLADRNAEGVREVASALASDGTIPKRRAMESGSVKLIHSVPESQLEAVLREGLRAQSSFDDLGLEMRRGVVYGWLRPEDDRMWGGKPGYVRVVVTVNVSRCRVAEMDFASLALMYLQGQGGRPKNPEAASLLAKVYELTSVPLSEYRQGMFSTPEVLVKGNIAPTELAVATED